MSKMSRAEAGEIVTSEIESLKNITDLEKREGEVKELEVLIDAMKHQEALEAADQCAIKLIEATKQIRELKDENSKLYARILELEGSAK